MKSLMILAAVLVLMVLCGEAMATKPKPPKAGHQEQMSENNNRNYVSGGDGGHGGRAHATGGSGGQATGGWSDSDANATASTGASTSTAEQSVVSHTQGGDVTDNSSVTIEGDEAPIYDFPSNSAYAPPAFSNIRCGEVLGLGFTNVNGSGSFGIPVPRFLSGKTKDCEADADANWLAEAGLFAAAIEAKCATRSMRSRFGGGEKGKKNQTAACILELKSQVSEKEALRRRVLTLERELESSQRSVEICTDEFVKCQAK